MDADGFLARENEAHRLPGDTRQERRLRLDRHVLLAAERAAVGNEDDVEGLGRDIQECRDLPVIVEDPLPLREERHRCARVVPGRVARRSHARLRLQIQMLDALRLPRSLDDMSRRRERSFRVAAVYDRAREEVPLRTHAWSARLERLLRIRHRREDLVLHLDEPRGLARRPRVHGGDRGEDVAHAPRFLSLGHEARPVLDDQAVEALARHVLRRDDCRDAGVRRGLRRIDALDLRARVRRERHRAVKHLRKSQIAHVGSRAERELFRLVAVEARPDPARAVGRRQRLAPPQARRRLERLEDLHVAGAPAEMRVELPADLLLARVGIGVEDALDLHRDAGNAEPALKPRHPGERLPVDVPLLLRHSLERQDALPGGALRRHRARSLRVPVHEHDARPALPLRRTPVLGRRDPRMVPQQLQQRRPLRHVEGPPRAIEVSSMLMGCLSFIGTR